MTDATNQPASDLLYGMNEVAKHLSITKRQALHLHEKGEIPTFKMGRTVCARRSTLAKHFAAQEAAAAAAARDA